MLRLYRPRNRFLLQSIVTLILIAVLLVILMVLRGAPWMRSNTPITHHSNGDLSNWEDTSSLSARRNDFAVAIAGKTIYSIGGYELGKSPDEISKCNRTVERASIQADGSLSAWQPVSSLLTARCYHAGVAADGYLYAIGGHLYSQDGQAHLTSVERSKIQPDGSLGPWEYVAPLNTAHVGGAAVASDSAIYVLGGSKDGEAVATVERAPIQPDGSLGSWEELLPMTIERDYLAAVMVNGYIYALGGGYGAGKNSVERAAVLPDGTLSAWQPATPMLTSRFSFAAATIDGYLYAIGGNTNGVERAALTSDGSLEAWQEVSPLVHSRKSHAAAATDEFLYVLGGDGDLRGRGDRGGLRVGVMDSVERAQLVLPPSTTDQTTPPN